jgi:hypothetical protein
MDVNNIIKEGDVTEDRRVHETVRELLCTVFLGEAVVTSPSFIILFTSMKIYY